MRAPGRWRSPPRSTVRCGPPDVPRGSARRQPSTHLRAKPFSRKSCASFFACSSTVPVIISAWPFAAGGDRPRAPNVYGRETASQEARPSAAGESSLIGWRGALLIAGGGAVPGGFPPDLVGGAGGGGRPGDHAQP